MKVHEDTALLGQAEELAALLAALTALRRGDASARLPLHWSGLAGKVADVSNATWSSRTRRWRPS